MSSAIADQKKYMSHSFCDPSHLDSSRRFERVTSKIAAEMKHEAIVCMQEISQGKFASAFTLFM